MGLVASAACGGFPDQGSKSCTLHWQGGSSPLSHQRSPPLYIFKILIDVQKFHTLKTMWGEQL